MAFKVLRNNAEQAFLLAILASEENNGVYSVASSPSFTLWPLALTFKAIGQLNHSLDAVPRRIVRGRVFDLSSRTAFAEDYRKLGMHLNIAGWAIKTSRITAALVAIVVRATSVFRQ